jgi:hypothetical protein
MTAAPPRPFSPSPDPRAAEVLEEMHDLCATAAGYAISIERSAEYGSTARFAFELRLILDCLSNRIERLKQRRRAA